MFSYCLCHLDRGSDLGFRHNTQTALKGNTRRQITACADPDQVLLILGGCRHRVQVAEQRPEITQAETDPANIEAWQT